jgi:hypothetical protein
VSSSRGGERRRPADAGGDGALGEALFRVTVVRGAVVLRGEVVLRRDVAFRLGADGRLDVFDVRAADVREAVLRDGAGLALELARFCCLPLDEEDEDRAAWLERAADEERLVVREVERAVRPLAAFGRLDPPVAGRVRARAGERGVFGLAMTRPFLANLDSFPISSVSSIAYRD